MKRFFFTLGIAGALLFASTPGILAQDMRAMTRSLEQQRHRFLEKAEQEKEQAQQERESVLKAIKADRDVLASNISRLREENQASGGQVKDLQEQLRGLEEKETVLAEELKKASAETTDLAAFVRAAAREFQSLLKQSHQGAFLSDRTDVLAEIARQDRFPDMADIEKMTALVFEDIRGSGEVRIQKGSIIGRDGVPVEADILVLGNFTAAYRHRQEVGFLLYSSESGRFFALSKLPPAPIQKEIAAYMEGGSDFAAMDVSRGGALRQLTHRLSWTEQISQGGPMVWPILGIFVLGVLIVFERVIVLFRHRIDGDKFMGRVSACISEGKWETCRTACAEARNKAVPRVILSGIEARHMDRTDLENSLQESILREIPQLERFLSTLGILAAIAPLLGLLGTVAGMMDTFHVITYFGAGDPRMMSGGISEALVTTMLGLSVAIPLMLCHTLLSRKVDNIVGQMEEKVVAFVNAVSAWNR